MSDGVVEKPKRRRGPLHHASHGPPPPAGEETQTAPSSLLPRRGRGTARRAVEGASPLDGLDKKERNGFREPDRIGAIGCLSTSGFHRIAYTDWGPVDADDVVVCVHGLTRQGRDFDVLAARLADAGYRVVCPDLVGRGLSDALPNALDYVFPQHCSDMAAFLATLGPKRIHWLGTSFGGMVGIVLAAMARSPIVSLVVNDIGPDTPVRAATRVALRLAGEASTFASLDEVTAHMRRIHVACGPLSDAQWEHMARHSVRRDPASGRYVMLMDPKVTTAFQWLWYYSMSLWRQWRDLDVPVLAIHGAESDFMPPELIARMRQSMPGLETLEIPETGHMPMLMSRLETDAILAFLQSIR